MDELSKCGPVSGVTHSEEGRLGEVITPPMVPFGHALVRTATGQENVDVTLVSPVSAGDLVLIHAGAALVKRCHEQPERESCR